jgi:dTDP-glucose pyrophosphorylase
MKPTVVVPMAGNGTRFSEAGYETIKPLIPIDGKPMIERVVNSITFDANWIFIVQAEHRKQFDLDRVLEGIRPGCRVIDTGGGVTEGAACTVLLAEPYINCAAPLIILNSDNIIEWDEEVFTSIKRSDYLDGMIVCFSDVMRNPKWSFVEVTGDSWVTRVAEKDPISTWATAGLYIWFYPYEFFIAAKEMIEANDRVNNEFYITPVYNYNIKKGSHIMMTPAISMHGVGTPEDLEIYLKHLDKQKVLA